MVNSHVLNLQIGKNGITKEFLENLKDCFNKKGNDQIRVSLLKSSGRDKEMTKKISEDIINYLDDSSGEKGKFTSRIIGFTIVLKKWRKPRK